MARVGPATVETPRESLWPPVAVLRDTALLLIALLLVTLFTDGNLALVLSLGLILAWVFVSPAARRTATPRRCHSGSGSSPSSPRSSSPT